MQEWYSLEEIRQENQWSPDEAARRVFECGPLLDRDIRQNEKRETVYNETARKIIAFSAEERVRLLHGRIATLRRIVEIKQDLVDRTLTEAIQRERDMQNQILALRLALTEKERELELQQRQREMNRSAGPASIPPGKALRSALEVAASSLH